MDFLKPLRDIEEQAQAARLYVASPSRKKGKRGYDNQVCGSRGELVDGRRSKVQWEANEYIIDQVNHLFVRPCL